MVVGLGVNFVCCWVDCCPRGSSYGLRISWSRAPSSNSDCALRPIQDLSEKYNILQSAMAASERVFKLLDTPGTNRGLRAAPFHFDKRLLLSNSTTSGSPIKTRLGAHRRGFRIEPGETIAVVGHTGAGKTTISSLLLRFYESSAAASESAERHPRFDLEQLRRNFGVVLQDPHLFTGTSPTTSGCTSAISAMQLTEAADA